MKLKLLVIVMMLIPSMVDAEVLESIQDKELSNVLANFEILAEANTAISKGMYVRIIKVQDFAECDSSPATCPKSRVYITVSEYGEQPEQKVYRLPSRHNWRFDKWIKLPETDGPDDYVQFRLKSQKPAKDLKKKWWINESYIVRVNYRSGKWDRE